MITPNTTTASSASCRPPPGHTYLAVGQDLFSIVDYVTTQYNYSLHHRHNSTHPTKWQDFVPSAVMSYTDIQSLRGLNTPADYGSGVEYADGVLFQNEGPGPALQLGLWLNGTAGCREIVQGRWNANINRLVTFLSGGHHVHPSCGRRGRVFVRIGYEFDNPQFGYYDAPVDNDHAVDGPTYYYRHAFRHIVHACRAVPACAARTVFVWHSWAAGVQPPYTLHDFYPGSDVVDWIGISVFTQLYAQSTLGNRHTMQNVLNYAVGHNKPVMIAESTPFGGIPSLSDPWREWFAPVLRLIAQHDIGMWCYIHCDWDTQPMWHGVGFGDTRLHVNATVERLWQQHVLHNDRFIISTAPCAPTYRGGRDDRGMAYNAATAVGPVWLPDMDSNNLRAAVTRMASYYRGKTIPFIHWVGAALLLLVMMCACYCCQKDPNRPRRARPLLPEEEGGGGYTQLDNEEHGGAPDAPMPQNLDDGPPAIALKVDMKNVVGGSIDHNYGSIE